ncbi:MAG: RluA family pseudouridine synthase [Planctomycetes bacterium]|nr:RluA family pseudouridine synthase [Planctomycetota bacterium]
MSALEVLHCDNHVLVVAKPACLPIVPDATRDESLLERAKAWVKREYAKPGDVFLGVVHRLDRPVSGLVVFARTSKAADRLTRQFRERDVAKTYLGVVEGTLPAEAGELEQHLLKDKSHNLVRLVPAGTVGAKLAHTSWRRLRSAGGRHLLELEPHTGRSHQLRLACARGLGTPLVGDRKYGARETLPDRSIALHACALAFEHPTLGERLAFELAPPATTVWDLAR